MFYYTFLCEKWTQMASLSAKLYYLSFTYMIEGFKKTLDV